MSMGSAIIISEHFSADRLMVGSWSLCEMKEERRNKKKIVKDGEARGDTVRK